MRTDRRVLFALVSLALLIFSMQFSMIAIALPDVIVDLDAPLRWVGWVVTIFVLAQAVSMPIVGKLSDDLGRRTVFVGGLATFAGASLICAVSPNIYVLIAARAVQGLGGASMVTSATGIVADAFPSDALAADRARAIGLLSAVFPIGAIIGPNLGAVIVEEFGWRWTFALNAPLGLLAVVAAIMVMPASAGRPSRPIDFAGAGLLAVSATALIYSLTELSQTEGGPNLWVVAAGFVIALVAALAFVRREWRALEPILDLRLLKQKEFAFFSALNFLFGVPSFGVFSFIPLYAESAYGMSSSERGVLLTPRAVVIIAASSLVSILLPRTGYRKPIVLGLGIMAGGLVVLSLGVHEPAVAGVRFSNFSYLAAVVAIAGFGFGVAVPPVSNAGLELAPGRIAAITGIRGMFGFLGGSIGTTVIVLVTSRADSTAQGLEVSFLGLAVISALMTVLVLGIPDRVGAIMPPAPGTEPESAPAAIRLAEESDNE